MTPRYGAAAVFFAALLLATIALVTPSGLASPSPEYVDVTRFDDPEPDGCDVNGCSLREAVAVGSERPGEQVINFLGDSNVHVGPNPIEITGDLRIIGVFDGTQITAVNQLFRVTETGAARFERLVLRDIETFYPGAPCGLAIGNDGVAILDEVIIEENNSRYGGVGLCNYGTITVKNSVLRDNYAAFTGSGAGLLNAGEAIIEHSTFHSNTTVVLGGGAIDNAGTMTIRDSTFSENRASGAASAPAGGAIFNSGQLTIERTTVADNHASDGFCDDCARGAGIANTGALVIRDSTIRDNTADQAGGIFSEGETTIERSTISGNEAGGILNDEGATMTVVNTTVTNNHGAEMPDAGFGGISNHGTLTVRNSTIADNTETYLVAGGLYNAPGASVEIGNTILAGNGEENCNVAGQWATTGGNVADDDSCLFGAGDLVVDEAGLMPLADYGGPTELHALEPDSPAIDAGQSPCPSPDQRGAARPVNGVCDAGSYEFGGDLPPPTATPPGPTTPPAYPIGDANCNDRIDPGDVMAELRLTAGLLEPSFCGRDGPCVDFADKCFPQWTDTDCNERIEPLDALRVAMHLAGEAPEQPGGCAPIGQLPGG